MKNVKGALSSVKAAGWSAWKSANEAVLPAQTSSSYLQDGKLTPAEFTTAGDFLVRTYPTWSWAAGDPAKAKSHMPDKRKQFLITRNVPCHQRAAAVTSTADAHEEILAGDDGEDWVAADGPEGSSRRPGGNKDEDIPTLGDEDEGQQGADDDDVPDIDDLAIEEDEADEAALPATSLAASNIKRTRTYDLLITYDKYHGVPMAWLIGYDEDRQLLKSTEVFQDISENYARKTATTEPFPHTAVPAVGIHPCKHAQTMKRLAEMYTAGGARQLDSEHYMVLFLKFIASVIPTIEYDYTSSAGGW